VSSPGAVWARVRCGVPVKADISPRFWRERNER
jgi:hypothetical protein